VRDAFNGINGVMKRATDIAIAGLALFLLWPLMLAIAIGVKRSSSGPVLFRQRRYGSMASRSGLQVPHHDRLRRRRSYRAGAARRSAHHPLRRISRKTSLDELPQLFNASAVR